MKTIDLLVESLTLSELLELASEESIILKTAEGREFVIAETDDFEKEIELVRQNQELMQFLEQRSREKETYTLNQVKERLNLK